MKMPVYCDLQLSGRNGHAPTVALRTLADLRETERATLAAIDLPEDLTHRLMLLGFLPGSMIEAARSAPGGDPRVYRVDGSEIALRRETAQKLTLTQGE